MIKINIKKEFPNDWITREAGEKLRNMIIAGEEKGENVEIDFSDKIIASTSFFDEGIAKLAEHGWDKSKFENLVIIKNINKHDAITLEKVCKNRNLL